MNLQCMIIFITYLPWSVWGGYHSCNIMFCFYTLDGVERDTIFISFEAFSDMCP